MNSSTIQKLLELNKILYEERAAEFSATRQKPWRGWTRLESRLRGKYRSVLDAGCGNGRFGVFLGENRGDYTGVDQSAALLEVARAELPNATLIEADLLTWEPQKDYDLTVLMGVLHHVPTLEAREALVNRLARRSKYLALSFWRFDVSKALNPGELELEEGDYLLGFGKHGVRYCHYASDAEIDHLVQSTGMTVTERFGEDDQNEYVLLVR